MSVVTHFAVVVAVFVGVTPRYQHLQGHSGVRELAELAIPFDLVPEAQAAPAPSPAPEVAPRPIPRKGHVARHARPTPAAVPVTMATGPDASEPPPFEESPGSEESDSPEGAAPVAAAAALPPEPIPISAGEAGYLRTYEAYPSLPRSLAVWGRVYSVLAQVCVSDRGQVADVAIKHGAAPELDRAVTVAMRSWRYRPRMVAGAPRPFCHLIKLEFSLR